MFNRASKWRFLSLVAVFICLSSFPQQTQAQQPATGLFGKTWTLTEIEGRKVNADKANIQFDRDQKRVSGSGGCNRFSGAFEIQDSSLTFSRTISTKMACVDVEVQRTETRFLSLLDSVTRYGVEGSSLRLYAKDRVVLVFSERAADSQPNLVGRPWQLVKFQGSDGTAMTPDDRSKYTVSFQNNGQVSVRLDCNRGSGTWTSAGPNQLRLGALILTQAMCSPVSFDDRMSKDWKAIRAYVFRNGHLFLYLMTGGGIYEFEPSEETASTSSTEGRVTGTISYRQRIALTQDAVVEVKLVDSSRADAPSETIAEQTIKPAGRQVPLAFEIAYDLRRIDPRHRYTIQVRILEGGQLRFTTDEAYTVITLGHPDKVDVIVKPVGR